MGSFELQIFVSLFVILGAAFVALLCDFLKGNNERLREKNIELSVRHEERDKREDLLDRAQRQAWNTAVQAQEAWLYQSMRDAGPESRASGEQAVAQAVDAPGPGEDPAVEQEPQLTFSIGVKPLEGPLSLPKQEMRGIDAQPEPPAHPASPAMPRMAPPAVEDLSLTVGGPCYPSPEPPNPGPVYHDETTLSNPMSFPATTGPVEPVMQVPGNVVVDVPLQAASSGYRWSEPAESFAWAAWRLLPGFVRSWLERTPPEAAQCPLEEHAATEPSVLFVPPFALVEFGSGYVTAMPGMCLILAEQSPAQHPLVPLQATPAEQATPVRWWEARPETRKPHTSLPMCPLSGQVSAQLVESGQLFQIQGEVVALAGVAGDCRPCGCIVHDSVEPAALPPVFRGLRTAPDWVVASFDPPVAGPIEVARPATCGGKPTPLAAIPLAGVGSSILPAMGNDPFPAAFLAPTEVLLPVPVPCCCGYPGSPLIPDFAPSREALPAHSAAPLLSIAADIDAAFSAESETAPEPAGTAPVSLPGLHRLASRLDTAPIATAVRIPERLIPERHCAAGSPAIALSGQIRWVEAETPLPPAAGACHTILPVPVPSGERSGGELRFERLIAPAIQMLPEAGPLAVPPPQVSKLLPERAVPDGEPACFTLPAAGIPSASLALETEPLQVPTVEVPVPIEQGLVRRTYHLFAALPPLLDDASGSLPPARFDLSAPDAPPEAPPEPVVRIRVLREDDAFAQLPAASPDPLAPVEAAADAPSALESFSARAGFLSGAAASSEAPTVAGDFAPEAPVPQKSGAQSPGIVTMPSFGEMKTLFFPAAPNIERKPDRPGVVVKMPCANALSCSPGAHPPSILQQLLSRQELFSGMAMVLAVVDYQKVAHLHPASVIEPILDEAFDAMRAGAGKNAFLCRCADGEFVILWPRDLETNPQKALHEVTERLWDFQLRTLGAVPLIFSWGNLEASGESLAGVLTSTRDKMTESARNRRSTASGVGRFRKHAVS